MLFQLFFSFFCWCNTYWLDSWEQATHENDGSYWSPADLHRVHYSRTNLLVPLLSNGSWVGGAPPKNDCRRSRVSYFHIWYYMRLYSLLAKPLILHTTTSRCRGVNVWCIWCNWYILVTCTRLSKVFARIIGCNGNVYTLLYILCVLCVCCNWGTLIGSVVTLSTHIHPPPRELFSELSVVFDLL